MFWDWLRSWLGNLVGTDADTVAGALVLLAVTTAIAIAGRVAKASWDWAAALTDRHNRRTEILTDIVIYARTYEINVGNVASPQALATLKETIRAAPDGFKGFGAAINDSDVYTAYKEIRRSLTPLEISRCDAFFDQARLFELYYTQLGSDAFGALNLDRKIKVIDNFGKIGRDLAQATARMMTDVTRLDRIAKRINLDAVLPKPTQPTKTGASGKAEGQTMGGSGP